jgi:hypothetical protein
MAASRVWVFGDGPLATSAARGLTGLGTTVVRISALATPGPWTWMATAPVDRASPDRVAVVVGETADAVEAWQRRAEAAGMRVGVTIVPLRIAPADVGAQIAVGTLWGPDIPWVARLQTVAAERPHALWLPNALNLRPVSPHGLAQAIVARLEAPSHRVWVLQGTTRHSLHELGELILRHAGHASLRPRSAPLWATALRYQLRTAPLREWVAATRVPRETEGWEPEQTETRWDWVEPRASRGRGGG